MTDDEKTTSTDQKTTPQGGQEEPSMEDILTSIRRILSEEGSDDVEIPEGEEMMERDQGPDSQADSGIDFTEIESDREMNDRPSADTVSGMSPPDRPDGDNILLLTPEMRAPAGAPVISSATAEASADALSQLARAILDHRDINIGTRDVTLEGMVRQMLRPLLKEWLDRNLPYLIERLVKKEIDMMINRAERL